MAGEGIFEGVVQWDLQAGGREFKLPTFYRDLSALTVAFTAPTREVQKRLPHHDMHPVEVIPGRSLVTFTGFEYRDCDVGPYNEVSIAFPITWRHWSLPGLTFANDLRERRFPLYIWQLPVTTELARYGGVELYGLPKSLADIQVERRGADVACLLSTNGHKALEFSVRAPSPGRSHQTRFVLHSMRNGSPILANVLLEPLESAEAPLTEARLDLGTGPIADELRQMDVGGRSVFAMWWPRARAILFGPRNVADD